MTASNMQNLILTTLREHRVSIVGVQLACSTCGPVAKTEPEHQAEAVTTALTEGGAIEWGIRRVGYTATVPQDTEKRARWLTEGPGLEGHPEEVVSRVVGQWAKS
jgi:hypothetical protein